MELPTTHTDPSSLFGSVVTLIGAVLALAVGFGVDLTEEQVALILGVATAVGPLVTAFLIRRKAWAPATVDRELDTVADMTAEDGQITPQSLIGLLVVVIAVIVIVQLL